LSALCCLLDCCLASNLHFLLVWLRVLDEVLSHQISSTAPNFECSRWINRTCQSSFLITFRIRSVVEPGTAIVDYGPAMRHGPDGALSQESLISVPIFSSAQEVPLKSWNLNVNLIWRRRIAPRFAIIGSCTEIMAHILERGFTRRSDPPTAASC
jgi:hypothetical protein